KIAFTAYSASTTALETVEYARSTAHKLFLPKPRNGTWSRCKLGTWLISRKLSKATARKSSPSYLSWLGSTRLILLLNFKTTWMEQRRGYLPRSRKQALRLKNTLPKMVPDRKSTR